MNMNNYAFPKKFKRIVTVILILCVLAPLPAAGYAAPLPPDAIHISTEAQLRAIPEDATGYYALDNNIFLTGEWSPIINFMGKFDGRGHSINGLYTSRQPNSGVFASANGAVIVNLGVNIATQGVRAIVYAGGLVGYCEDSSISNCYVYGNVDANNSAPPVYAVAGGLLGYCSNTIISDCYASGSVNTYSYMAGAGITTSMAGGLIGQCSNIIIADCYAGQGSVTANAPSFPSFFSDVAGGLIAVPSNSTMLSCYRLSTKNISARRTNSSGVALTPEAMQSLDSFDGWDFNRVWMFIDGENNDYPVLLSFYYDIDGFTDAVTGVELSKKTITLVEGETDIVRAAVSPISAADKDVSWSSSNAGIATVDGNGRITAVSAGTAVITVRTADGGFTDDCAVTVTPYIHVSGVSLDKTSVTLGGTVTSETLTAIVAPADAIDKTVTWSSSDTGVATVNNSGVISAVAVGTANVTVTTVEGGFTASCKVTVNPISVTGIRFNYTAASTTSSYYSGLTATVTPANATNKTVAWSSGDTSVATVSGSGSITRVSFGSAVITAKTADGGFTADFTINFYDNATSIEINKTEFELAVGSTETLTATIEPPEAQQDARWSSSNSNVASVDANTGIVTGVSEGTATISAQPSLGTIITTSCIVNVVFVNATGVTLDKTDIILCIGASDNLSVTFNPPDASDKTVTWSSSDANVARVNGDGKITGVSAGAATITATAAGGLTASCNVTVRLPETIYITTEAQLRAIPYRTADIYILENDINLTSEWAPILDFCGGFDGQGYTIGNLYILVDSYRTDAGLFGTVNSGAKIKDVNIDIGAQGVTASGADIYDTVHAGALVGHCYLDDGGPFIGTVLIENCNITGGDVGANSQYYGMAYAGGLVGRCYGKGAEISIRNCSSSVAVKSDKTYDFYAGGLTGALYGDGSNRISLTDNYASGDVSAPTGTAGGLVGFIMCDANDTIAIEGCLASGDISTAGNSDYANAGGLIGYGICSGANNLLKVGNCYATGDIYANADSSSSYASAYAGGLIANFSCSTNGTVIIENCYASGSVLAETYTDDVLAGGLIACRRTSGANSSLTITNSYRLASQVVAGKSIDDSGDELTPEQMRSSESFDSWDFYTVWGYIKEENNGFPILRAIYSLAPGPLVAPGDLSGDGDINLQDVLMLYQYTRGKLALEGNQLAAADVNGDGKFDIQDVLLVYQYSRGKITEFPS